MGDDPLKKIPEDPSVPLQEGDDGTVDLSEDLEFLKWREKNNEVEKKEHELVVERSMLRQRQIYAFLLFGLISIWLFFIGFVILLAGAGSYPSFEEHLFFRVRIHSGTFHLADSVLIALISTTTINVLGLFYIVARWLFPTKNIELPPPAKKR